MTTLTLLSSWRAASKHSDPFTEAIQRIEEYAGKFRHEPVTSGYFEQVWGMGGMISHYYVGTRAPFWLRLCRRHFMVYCAGPINVRRPLVQVVHTTGRDRVTHRLHCILYERKLYTEVMRVLGPIAESLRTTILLDERY